MLVKKRSLVFQSEPSDETSSSNRQQQHASSQPASNNNNVSPRPRKTGSLALFLRKVYHVASVRLRDLCERLDIDASLRAKMWTCFEYTLRQHIDLMEGRHLDQLLMCAMYVIAKVTGNDRAFQDIMKNYRMQPQAQSHVYRSVLLTQSTRARKNTSPKSSHGSPSSYSLTHPSFCF